MQRTAPALAADKLHNKLCATNPGIKKVVENVQFHHSLKQDEVRFQNAWGDRFAFFNASDFGSPSSSRQARYALDLQEYDLEIIHRAGARHHIADIISRTPATMIAAAVATATNEMKHYYNMVQEVTTTGVVPTNPEAFEQMLNQDLDLVGTQSCKYQDSKMFGDTISQQSVSNALKHASRNYSITPTWD